MTRRAGGSSCFLALLLVGVVGRLPAQENMEGEVLTVRKGFHIAGIPKLYRDARVDLTFTHLYVLVQKGKKEVLRLPYERICKAQRLVGEREYPRTTYALVLAGGAPGALLLMKKRKVDTLIFEFVNERNGQMAAVMQIPREWGPACKEWLARFRVALEDPPLRQWPPVKERDQEANSPNKREESK